MSIRIGSMSLSLGAIRSLRLAEERIAQSSSRLASGLRINRASDDPAGLMVSERFRAELASLSRAQLNTQDGLSLAQTAQSGLAEISSLLSEARGLAVQSSTGSLDGQTRAQLDDQFQAILADIDAIAQTTRFAAFSPLADDSLQLDLAVGIQAGDTFTVAGVDATADGIGVRGLRINNPGPAGNAIDDIDDAISTVASLAAQFGVTENRLASRSRLLSGQIEATSAAESRIRDADFALESARLARAQLVQESALAVISQANANMGLVLRLLE